MKKISHILFALLCAFLCLSCNTNLKSKPQFSGEKSKLSPEIFEKIDYLVKSSGESEADDWRRQQFQTLWMRSYKVKRRTSLKESEYTYPRYTVVEEVYENENLAARRLERIREKPSNLSVEYSEYWIVTGFQNQKNVYFIQTDSVMFGYYMDDFAAKLAEEIKK